KGLVQLARMAAAELGEYLPLDLAREIRARARVRYEELGKAKWCAHPPPLSMVTRLFMRLVNADEKTLEASFSTECRGCPAWGQGNTAFLPFLSPARRVRRGSPQLRVARRRRRSPRRHAPRIRPRSSCPLRAAG